MELLIARMVSALTILNIFSPYLMARLRANPLLSAQATAAQQAHDVLFSAQTAAWCARQARMAAVSVRDASEYQLDSALRSLRATVQAVTHNDRASKLYTALFPDGFTAVIRQDPEDKLVLVRKMLSQLAEFQDPDLTPATQSLQAEVDAMVKTIADLGAAVTAEQAAVAALATARQQYCVHYEEIYHQIVVILGSRRLAETYFRSPHRQDAASTTSSQPQPVPAPVPATSAPAPVTPITAPVPASSGPATVTPITAPVPATSGPATVTPMVAPVPATSGPAPVTPVAAPATSNVTAPAA